MGGQALVFLLNSANSGLLMSKLLDSHSSQFSQVVEQSVVEFLFAQNVLS